MKIVWGQDLNPYLVGFVHESPRMLAKEGDILFPCSTNPRLPFFLGLEIFSQY